jgi:hypothetical protein
MTMENRRRLDGTSFETLRTSRRYRMFKLFRSFNRWLLGGSSRPHLQQDRDIYFPLIRSQFFFFTLRTEHGHAVGEFVAFSADVGGDVVLISASAMRNA